MPFDFSQDYNQKGFAPIFIIILVAVLGIGGYFVYTNYLNSQTKPTRTEQITQTPIPSPPTQATSTGSATGFLPRYTKSEELTPEEASKTLPLLNKEYLSTNGFSIKYPALDWKIITEGGYLNSINLTNKAGTVSINISEGQYPYGFSGPVELKKQELKIAIDGKEYTTTEFSKDSGAYVDFKVEKGTKSFNILFGSDYPALNTQNTSLNDYLLNKDTILYILSTFKFTQ